MSRWGKWIMGGRWPDIFGRGLSSKGAERGLAGVGFDAWMDAVSAAAASFRSFGEAKSRLWGSG